MPTGKGITRLAAKHLDERYVFGSIVPLSNSSWTGPWDCAEFASWCVYQVAGKIFGCRPTDDSGRADAYTGYWGLDAKKQKCTTSVEVAASIPGAFVLRLPQPGATGHIAISSGDGATIEAMDSRHGVTNSTLDGRRWDFGILVPNIDYESGEAIELSHSTTVIHANIDGVSVPVVKNIQKALRELNYMPGPIDGKYGPLTTAAVRAFQIDKKLVPDGEVGSKTARALKIQWPAE